MSKKYADYGEELDYTKSRIGLIQDIKANIGAIRKMELWGENMPRHILRLVSPYCSPYEGTRLREALKNLLDVLEEYNLEVLHRIKNKVIEELNDD